MWNRWWKFSEVRLLSMPAVALGPPSASQGRTVLIMLPTVITLVILTGAEVLGLASPPRAV